MSEKDGIIITKDQFLVAMDELNDGDKYFTPETLWEELKRLSVTK